MHIFSAIPGSGINRRERVGFSDKVKGHRNDVEGKLALGKKGPRLALITTHSIALILKIQGGFLQLSCLT